jgi:ligand-binding sensor domain-containing protein
MVVDSQTPETVYAGVVNGKRFGGVFESKDAGQSWSQIGAGLDEQDVFSLAISPAGVLLAGTSGGIYRLHEGGFLNVGHRLKEEKKRVTIRHKGHRKLTTKTIWVPDGKIHEAVRGLAYSNGEWYAATASGVYRSGDAGFAWRGGPIHGTASFNGVAAQGDTVIANAGSEIYLSPDKGQNWQTVSLPTGWQHVRRLAIDRNGGIWVGSRLGVSYSEDRGQTWQKSDLPLNNISGLKYDAKLNRVVVSSYTSNLVLGIDPAAKNWIWWNPGWRTRSLETSDGHLVAATLLHGVIVEPKNPQLVAARGGVSQTAAK